MNRPKNRLALEQSPYLRQHDEDPVQWWPFGEEAFAAARAADKPIFLSIGYSTCHWCHVMAKESFQNEAIAEVLNEECIAIKVDREERPDVDQIYMQSVLLMAGQGGWPLSLWLTPDLEPFYGGTYFPPVASRGRPGFGDVCRWLGDLWRKDRTKITAQAAQLMQALQRESAIAAPDEALECATLCALAERDLDQAFDEQWGGFGHAPKFPRPATLAFLLHRRARGSDSARNQQVVSHTLTMMERGGIYDHVGGGFARYSTDDQWLVPHFEKMLYDNAQLVQVLLDAHQLEPSGRFGAIAADVLRFIQREMTDPSGGFHSAQDADSEGHEGTFYLFRPADLVEALGTEDAEFVAQVFGVTQEGNFEGRSILYWPKSREETAKALGMTVTALETRWAPLRERLYDYREGRERVGQDDKILASWNGLMIAAAARAGRILKAKEWLQLSQKAAEFCVTHLVTADGALLRRWRQGEARYEASLDDYAFLADGLFTLWSATGSVRWLRAAHQLVLEAHRRFQGAAGGYYYAEARSDLVVRLKEGYDGALPSSNGVYAILLGRMGAALELPELSARVQPLVACFAGELSRAPESHPYLLMAATEAAEGPRTIRITGSHADPAFEALLQEAHRRASPGQVIVPIPDEERAAFLELFPQWGALLPPLGAAAEGQLCEFASCQRFPIAP